MAWASSGGYPGVVSDGNSGLSVVGEIVASWVRVSPSGVLQVVDGSGAVMFQVAAGFNNDGGVFKHGLGLFDHLPPTAPTSSAAGSPGATYGAPEQAFLAACLTALRSIGLLT